MLLTVEVTRVLDMRVRVEMLETCLCDEDMFVMKVCLCVGVLRCLYVCDEGVLVCWSVGVLVSLGVCVFVCWCWCVEVFVCLFVCLLVC